MYPANRSPPYERYVVRRSVAPQPRPYLHGKAEEAKELLERAGGTVSVEEMVWVTHDQAGDARPRPACPACGSTRTQPYLHAGPAARVNMKCNDCGQLFRRAREET